MWDSRSTIRHKGMPYLQAKTTPHLEFSSGRWTDPLSLENGLPYKTPLYLSLILNQLGLSKAMRRAVVITTVLDYNANHGCEIKILII